MAMAMARSALVRRVSRHLSGPSPQPVILRRYAGAAAEAALLRPPRLIVSVSNLQVMQQFPVICTRGTEGMKLTEQRRLLYTKVNWQANEKLMELSKRFLSTKMNWQADENLMELKRFLSTKMNGQADEKHMELARFAFKRTVEWFTERSDALVQCIACCAAVAGGLIFRILIHYSRGY